MTTTFVIYFLMCFVVFLISVFAVGLIYFVLFLLVVKIGKPLIEKIFHIEITW